MNFRSKAKKFLVFCLIFMLLGNSSLIAFSADQTEGLKIVIGEVRGNPGDTV